MLSGTSQVGSMAVWIFVVLGALFIGWSFVQEMKAAPKPRYTPPPAPTPEETKPKDPPNLYEPGPLSYFEILESGHTGSSAQPEQAAPSTPADKATSEPASQADVKPASS